MNSGQIKNQKPAHPCVRLIARLGVDVIETDFGNIGESLMTIDELRNLNGTDGNEACHAFWDACGAELLALWEAANHVSHDHGEQNPEYYSHTKVFNSVLDALNAKAASMNA